MAQFWAQHSNIIIALISLIGTALTGLVSYFMKKNQQQRLLTIKAIKEVANAVSALKEETRREHSSNDLTLSEIRSKVSQTDFVLSVLSSDLKRLEGRMSSQQDTIHSFTEKITIVTSEIKAIFRTIDAPKRASDRR